MRWYRQTLGKNTLTSAQRRDGRDWIFGQTGRSKRRKTTATDGGTTGELVVTTWHGCGQSESDCSTCGSVGLNRKRMGGKRQGKVPPSKGSRVAGTLKKGPCHHLETSGRRAGDKISCKPEGNHRDPLLPTKITGRSHGTDNNAHALQTRRHTSHAVQHRSATGLREREWPGHTRKTAHRFTRKIGQWSGHIHTHIYL